MIFFYSKGTTALHPCRPCQDVSRLVHNQRLDFYDIEFDISTSKNYFKHVQYGLWLKGCPATSTLLDKLSCKIPKSPNLSELSNHQVSNIKDQSVSHSPNLLMCPWSLRMELGEDCQSGTEFSGVMLGPGD